jgi:hypothetical protein
LQFKLSRAKVTEIPSQPISCVWWYMPDIPGGVNIRNKVQESLEKSLSPYLKKI